MPFVDVASYFEEKWENCKATVSEISKDDKMGVSLVKSNKKMFSFDKICENLYGKQKKPTSADAVCFHSDCLELIEFKSGFKRKINKDNYDEEKMRCKETGNVCLDYKKLFEKTRKIIEEGLRASIRVKAIESYVTLHKKLLPGLPCSVSRLKFTAVIDANGDDEYVDTLSELGTGKHDKDSGNQYKRVRDALKRLTDIKDFNGNSYYYKSCDIRVLSVTKFSKWLEDYE